MVHAADDLRRKLRGERDLGRLSPSIKAAASRRWATDMEKTVDYAHPYGLTPCPPAKLSHIPASPGHLSIRE